MPLYEYRCDKCGQQTEVLENYTYPLIVQCPCGGMMERQIAAVSFKMVDPQIKRLGQLGQD
jgi:putative FmdB family regulatory protein